MYHLNPLPRFTLSQLRAQAQKADSSSLDSQARKKLLPLASKLTNLNRQLTLAHKLQHEVEQILSKPYSEAEKPYIETLRSSLQRLRKTLRNLQ